MIAHRPRRTSSRRHTALGFALMGVLALCGAGAPVHAQCGYEIIAEISAPPGALTLGVSAINDNQVIVGSFLTNGLLFRPYMWSAETGVVPIPLPPGVSEAQAMDVNENGEIVGTLFRQALSQQNAFHWQDGVWTELPSLPDATNTIAYAINNSGTIAGASTNAIVGPAVACIWIKDEIEPIALPIGPNSDAFDLSDSESVVGRVGGSPTPCVPFFWTPNSSTTLPTLENAFRSEALAINQHNSVVGRSFMNVESGSVPYRSWLFEQGQPTDLGVLPNANHRTIAIDVNNAGQIIGHSEGTRNATNTAFLWQNGAIIELETLVVDPPDFLWLGGALAINNHGFIVASNQAFGGQLLLAPINRPLGDVNIDCAVDGNDIADVLRDWGPCPTRGSCLCDIVDSATFQPPGDGVVDGADLAVVLGSWTVR